MIFITVVVTIFVNFTGIKLNIFNSEDENDANINSKVSELNLQYDFFGEAEWLPNGYVKIVLTPLDSSYQYDLNKFEVRIEDKNLGKLMDKKILKDFKYENGEFTFIIKIPNFTEYIYKDSFIFIKYKKLEKQILLKKGKLGTPEIRIIQPTVKATDKNELKFKIIVLNMVDPKCKIIDKDNNKKLSEFEQKFEKTLPLIHKENKYLITCVDRLKNKVSKEINIKHISGKLHVDITTGILSTTIRIHPEFTSKCYIYLDEKNIKTIERCDSNYGCEASFSNISEGYHKFRVKCLIDGVSIWSDEIKRYVNGLKIKNYNYNNGKLIVSFNTVPKKCIVYFDNYKYKNEFSGSMRLEINIPKINQFDYLNIRCIDSAGNENYFRILTWLG